MRNTIYANYGLMFQAGGEMEKYFRKKNWYNPYLKDVSNFMLSHSERSYTTAWRKCKKILMNG